MNRYKFESKEHQLELYDKLYAKISHIEGMPELMQYLKTIKFHEHPASNRFHGNYAGGLLHHSINVAYIFQELCHAHNIKIPERTWIICGLFHDVCKAKQRSEGWHHKGHSKLSLSIIEEFIELTPQEKLIIQYHMGYYSTSEFSTRFSEYTLEELSSANEDFVVCLFHYADMISSRCYEDLSDDS